MIQDYTNKVHYLDALGFPMTPSRWVEDPQYTDVARILTTWGGGMGGASKYILATNVDCDEIFIKLRDRMPIDVITLDGDRLVINPDYVVSATKGTVVQRTLESTNSNFFRQATRIQIRVLLPYGKRVSLTNEYMEYDRR